MGIPVNPKSIESFSDGSGDEGKYVGHFNGVVRTTESQASREMAKPAEFTQEYESFREEHEALTLRKKQLEQDLGGYSPTAFSKMQLKIRDTHKNNSQLSIRRWIEAKSRMEEERTRIKGEMLEIDKRIITIRGRLSNEFVDDFNHKKKPDLAVYIAQTNDLLQKILDVLVANSTRAGE